MTSLHIGPPHPPGEAALPVAERSSRVGDTLGAIVGGVVGEVLGAGFGLAARVRRNKPIHPAGHVGAGVLEVTAPAPDLGVPLLAEPGSHACVVRWSRSAGVPSPLPDVEGFALRVDDAGEGAPSDLLLASSGVGLVTRYLPRVRWPRSHGPMSTLLPVQGRTGALDFLVEPLDDADPPVRWRLSVAEAGSPWHALGTVHVAWGPDQPIRFDPVEHPLPGARQYPFVARLRKPAYLRARLGAPLPPS